jgi:hypothetical protein
MTKKDTSGDLTAVEERIKARLASVDETTQETTGQNISVKGSVFKLPTGATSQGPLNCIILDYINKNMYYPGEYIEGEYSQPECFAVNRKVKDMAPPSTVEKPVNEKCIDCDYNKFGSKGRGKKCSNNVLLAVIPDDFTDESEVYTIKVAAKGLKGWAKYVRELQAINVDPAQVVTSLSFVEGLSYPCLNFKHIGGNDRISEIGPFLPKADILLSE